MFAIFQTLSSTFDCVAQFKNYKKMYNRHYKNETESRSIFCRNYEDVRRLFPESLSHLGPKMDVDLQTIAKFQPTPITFSKKRGLTEQCQQYYCGTKPEENLEKVYQSVDLRTLGLTTRAKDQGQCGACYMFGTVAAMENSLLLDQKLVKNEIIGNARELNISELYGMTNIAGQSYCDGGNAVSALSFLQDFRDTTIRQNSIDYYAFNMQRAVDFVYNETSVQQGQQMYYKDLAFVPKVNQNNLPFIGMKGKFDNTDIITPNILITKLDSTEKFSEENIKSIFSYLSRGYVVITAMRTAVPNGQITLQNYNGQDFVHIDCDGNSLDHQVTFVGYGKKNNQWVWIVKNSWGPKWGDEGSFYVPIGRNSFCIEQEAIVLKSQFHDQRVAQNGQQLLDRTQGFMSNYKKSIYIDDNQTNLMNLSDITVACLVNSNCNPTIFPLDDGYDSTKYNNVDADSTDFKPNDSKSFFFTALIVILVIFVVGLVVVVSVICFCKFKKAKKIENPVVPQQQCVFDPYSFQNNQVRGTVPAPTNLPGGPVPATDFQKNIPSRPASHVSDDPIVRVTPPNGDPNEMFQTQAV